MNEIPLESCQEAGPEAERPMNEEEPCEDFGESKVKAAFQNSLSFEKAALNLKAVSL